MQALILAGGSGTRFWPLSRRARPKQLLAMGGDLSLLQTTAARLSPLIESDSIWVCTTEELAETVRRQLPEVPEQQVLAEPLGRNTAAAIGWSITRMPARLRAGVVAVLPADHFMAEPASFRKTLATAAELSERGDRIMTLGVLPTRPESGYGYLELGEELDASIGLRLVRRFTEKPDPEAAREFVASGRYLWNAGIFVFRGTTLLERLAVHQPRMSRALRTLENEPHRLAEIYAQLPSISIDHGLMEKLEDLATVPLDCGWSDLGSWEALWEQLDKDAQGNVCRGPVYTVDAQDNLIFAQEGAVAVVGAKGLVVVHAGDAVLVVPKERSQEVRRLVAELEKKRRDELL